MAALFLPISFHFSYAAAWTRWSETSFFATLLSFSFTFFVKFFFITEAALVSSFSESLARQGTLWLTIAAIVSAGERHRNRTAKRSIFANAASSGSIERRFPRGVSARIVFALFISPFTSSSSSSSHPTASSSSSPSSLLLVEFRFLLALRSKAPMFTNVSTARSMDSSEGGSGARESTARGSASSSSSRPPPKDAICKTTSVNGARFISGSW